MTRRVVLWRHGRTEWNVAGRVQGQTDTALDEVGVRQAAAAAARLASLRPVRILSSDLQRARHTAEELSRLTGVPVELDERLREMNFGEREGLTWKESWERFPDLMKAMLEDREERFPGAELHAEARGRVHVPGVPGGHLAHVRGIVELLVDRVGADLAGARHPVAAHRVERGHAARAGDVGRRVTPGVYPPRGRV